MFNKELFRNRHTVNAIKKNNLFNKKDCNNKISKVENFSDFSKIKIIFEIEEENKQLKVKNYTIENNNLFIKFKVCKKEIFEKIQEIEEITKKYCDCKIKYYDDNDENNIMICFSKTDAFDINLTDIQCEKDSFPVLWPVGINKFGDIKFIDRNKDPHILGSGPSGKGKSFLLKCMLALAVKIYNDNFDWYEVCFNKSDYEFMYYTANYKGTYYIDNLEEIIKTVEFYENIYKEAKEREKIVKANGFKSMGEYLRKNQLYKKDFKVKIITQDEFPQLKFLTKGDSKDPLVINAKKILSLIEAISGISRSSAIYMDIITQKATSDSVPIIILNNSTKFSLKQTSDSAARAASPGEKEDILLLKNLREREAAYNSTTEGTGTIVIPFLTEIGRAHV